jgi:hypothetical protein
MNHNSFRDADETSPTDNDSDNDNLFDGLEVSLGTNPLLQDSDGDGLTDGDEVHGYGTNPALADGDADGIVDGDEVLIYGTNPGLADSDGDGIADGQDVDILRVIFNSIPPEAFRPRASDTLLAALQAVERALAAGRRAAAAQTLEGLLTRFDGCSRSGSPDRNDWIIDCYSQVRWQIFVKRFLANVGQDSDQDGLWDWDEDRNGNENVDRGETDPENPDSDRDGLVDGQDVEFIQTLITRLPAAAFLNATVEATMVATLATVERQLRTSHTPVATAMSRLGQLRSRVNGCGSAPDSTDWIVDCARQRRIGRAIDRLIRNWQFDSDGDGLWDWEEDRNRNGQVDAGETDPQNPDSDNDVIPDGPELLGSNHSDPLDADTDDDGVSDNDEDWSNNGARDPGESDPTDADTDDDGAADGEEWSVTDLLDPDSDDDELPDGLELHNSLTCAVCADSDTDGIKDGEDVEYIVYTIERLPRQAFLDSSKRQTMLGRVQTVEMEIALGHIGRAKNLLQALRQRVDGCGTAPDSTDWVVTCAGQRQVRTYLELLLTNLSQ